MLSFTRDHLSAYVICKFQTNVVSQCILCKRDVIEVALYWGHWVYILSSVGKNDQKGRLHLCCLLSLSYVSVGGEKILFLAYIQKGQTLQKKKWLCNKSVIVPICKIQYLRSLSFIILYRCFMSMLCSVSSWNVKEKQCCVLWFSFCFDLMLIGFLYLQNNWIFLSMTSFCWLQISFIRSFGKYSPSNFDVKKYWPL